MRTKLYLGGGVVVAGLLAMLVWGLRDVADRPTFVVAFGGMLANLVMAFAAAMAFRLWRAQLVGQTEHATVVKLMHAVLATEDAMCHAAYRTASTMRGRVIHPDESPETLITSAPIKDSTETLLKRWRELETAIIEVRVAFGESESKPVADYMAHLLAFLMHFRLFLVEAAGGQAIPPAVRQPEWSWRGLLSGDFADVVVWARHEHMMVIRLVRWCEERLGRRFETPVPDEVPDEELRHIAIRIVEREDVESWVDQMKAVKASRSTRKPHGAGDATP